MRCWPLLLWGALVAANCDESSRPGGEGGGGVTPFEFVEEFETLDARIDGDLEHEGGRVGAFAPHPLAADAGDGSDGAFAPVEDATLAAGPHAFDSFGVPAGVTIDVAEGATIAVAGQFDLQGNLRLAGSATLVLGSGAQFCGSVEMNGDGDLRVQQLSRDHDLVVGCEGDGAGDISHEGATGGVVLESRGGIRVSSGSVQVDTGEGLLALRAGGDVVIELATFVNAGAGAAVEVTAGGAVKVLESSFIYVETPKPVAPLRIRAASLSIEQRSFVYAEGETGIDVIVAGALVVRDRSFVYADEHPVKPRVELVAASVALSESSFVYADDGGMSGGDVFVRSAGDVTVESTSHMYAGRATCAAGGALTVEAGGNVAVSADSSLSGGDSSSGTSCAAGAGGAVTVRAAGGIEATVIEGGTGDPVGAVTTQPGATVSVTPDPALTITRQGTFSTRGTSGKAGVLRALGATGDVRVEVRPDPSGDLLSLEQAVGRELLDGWTYRITATSRIFDDAAVDGIEARE